MSALECRERRREKMGTPPAVALPLPLSASFMPKHSRGQEVLGRNERELVDRCAGAFHGASEQSIGLPQTGTIQRVPYRARIREVRLTNAALDVAAHSLEALRI